MEDSSPLTATMYEGAETDRLTNQRRTSARKSISSGTDLPSPDHSSDNSDNSDHSGQAYSKKSNDAALPSPIALSAADHPKQDVQDLEEEIHLDNSDEIHPLPSAKNSTNSTNGMVSRTQLLHRTSMRPSISPSRDTSFSSGSKSARLKTIAQNANDWSLSPTLENPPIISDSPRASFFSVIPMFGSSSRSSIRSSIKEDDPSTAESAFVLSRLENAPLDGENTTTTWLTGQLRSAFNAIHSTVIGDVYSGDVDWEFWGALVNNYEATVRNQPKYFMQELAKGIPESLRGLMWQRITKSRSERYITMYNSLLTRSSKDEKLIMRDLPRTYPSHPYFKDPEGEGQTALFNVLRAYSNHDPDIGYCQGIAFIVGPLLLNMPEEESFCVLIQLMREYGFRELYSPKLIGLQRRLYQYEKLLESKFPKIANHLALLDLKANMYASQWFMTLFAYRFPLAMVFRIMDIVMAEGYDAVLRFSLALVQKNQEAILQMTEFEILLDFLQNGLFDEYIGDIDSLIYDASKIHLNKAQLDVLCKEHDALLRLSSPDYIEAESLKQENMKLNEKITFLKADYAAMCKENAQLSNKLLEMEDWGEKIQDRNDELEETVEALRLVLTDERKGAEAQVQMEMDILAQKNIRLTNQNAQLEEEIARLENSLAFSRASQMASDAKNEELSGKLEKFQILLNN